jgi:hypothetical protein
MLAIKVTATPEKVNIDGIIPLDSMFSQSPGDSANLLTIEQTSACNFAHAKHMVPQIKVV